MIINKLVIDTLKPLNIPVSFQRYNGTATTYITFFEYLQQGESYADNEEKLTGHYIQVDIWSKNDYSSIVDSVKTNMKNAGFRRTTETEIYENDTQIYHKSLRFFYAQNN